MPQRHRSELSESVSGEPLGTYRRVPRTFRSGRTCATAGCPTVLSIYNSGKQCAAHDVGRFRAAPVAATAKPAAPATGGRVAIDGQNAPKTPVGRKGRARSQVLVAPTGEISRRAS